MEALHIVYTGDWPDQHALLKRLIALDYATFGDIDISDEGTENYWTAIRSACFAHALVKGEEIVGYIDLAALTEEGAQELRAGRLHDGQLKNFIDEDQKGPLNLYVVVLEILPNYRRQGHAQSLWKASRNFFLKKEKKIGSIHATVWTEEGRHFFNKLQAQEVTRDQEGHTVVSIDPVDQALPLF